MAISLLDPLGRVDVHDNYIGFGADGLEIVSGLSIGVWNNIFEANTGDAISTTLGTSFIAYNTMLNNGGAAINCYTEVFNDTSSVPVETEDGAHLELSLAQRGPALHIRAGAGTVQDGGADLVRFRGTGTARASSGGITVRAAEGMDSWTGFATAHRLPALGAALPSFAITMLPPLHQPRR